VSPTALRRLAAEPLVHKSDQPTTVHVLKQFGRRVAQRREELSMTQETMMKQLNHLSGGVWGRSSASVWENGHAPPDITTVYYLAKVLKTRPEYLAYGVKMLESPMPRSAFIGEPIIPRTARIRPVRTLQRQVMVRRNWSQRS
jgi:transcriptional regulator with XRE-family HTH domain